MEKELENRLNKIEEDIAVIKVDLKEGFEEAKKERAELKARINETYNAVNGFIKVVTKLDYNPPATFSQPSAGPLKNSL